MQGIYAFVRRHGGLCISDEVQTGWGRTGDHFWGYQAHGIVPETIIKEVYDLTDRVRAVADERVEYRVGQALPKDELTRLIKELEKQMKQAAEALEFEKAALIRDQIYELRRQLQDTQSELPEWKRDLVDR